jgi:hypothetical protein
VLYPEYLWVEIRHVLESYPDQFRLTLVARPEDFVVHIDCRLGIKTIDVYRGKPRQRGAQSVELVHLHTVQELESLFRKLDLAEAAPALYKHPAL